MRPSISRRRASALAAFTAMVAVCLPAGAGAGPSPEARASAKCGQVTTRNGGRATFVNTVKARCRTGRRVARRANGKRYSFLGFDCKPEKRGNLGGKLYGCGRYKDGRGQGIGFIYTAP